jgi:hypothetical protein
MFRRLILGIAMFFCIVFGIASAHTINYHHENKEIQETKFSVNSEKLFFEAGKLFLETEHGGYLPLESIFYENDRCYTFLSSEMIQNEYYSQGYRCNSCGYTFVKTTPGAPGIYPVCKKYDWTLF